MHYGEYTWLELSAQTHKVVVLPLGSLEQHGHHLPVLTDSMIGDEIIRRAEEILRDSVFFLPMLWAGSSHHHRGFPGTVSISNDTYTRVLVDLVESLVGAGFRRIFLFNAHGGNVNPASAALYEEQLRYQAEYPDLWLALGSWMDMAAQQIADIDELEQKHVTHACELETSMLLFLKPKLVKLENAKGANIPYASDFYTPDFSRSNRVEVPRAFTQLSDTGAFGHPEKATAQKGAAIFDAAVCELVKFLREFSHWERISPGN